jgi:sugar O-acyltransferase (sialic acid O-acetyltransferase NeuD family)
MSQKKIGIYGAGGFAREVAWLLSTLEAFDMFEFVGYIDDAGAHSELSGKPVFSWERFREAHPDTAITIAIGNPAARQKVAERCRGAIFPVVEHQSVECSDSVRVGEGSIICAGSILTVDIEIGRHVHINLDCTVGHDVRMDDYATLAPGVHVSGNVHIGRGAYIGTGANIINGTPDKPLVLGEGAVIGAGACVTGDVEPRCLYAGVPAALKKRY